ncbi:MAG TPA: hypothetical protein VF101_09555 [Gaiellaceae bacterium]
MLRRYAQRLIVLIVLAAALLLGHVASPAGGNAWHAAVAAANGWSWDD